MEVVREPTDELHTFTKNSETGLSSDASERAYQAFAWTIHTNVRASREWTAAMRVIGYLLTNRISPLRLLSERTFDAS